MSKEEFLKIQTCVLKVNIHCDGCKQKVKKILQEIEGVYTIKIDSDQGKVTVSGSLDPDTLIKKLAKKGKRAELWGGASKANNSHQQNKVNNQFKDLQIDNGKGGNNKAQGGQKGGNNQPKGGQIGLGLNPQQLQQLKALQDMKLPQLKDMKMQLKDMKMPPMPFNGKDPNLKAAKFNLPEEDDLSDDEFDEYDDDEDEDEFDGESLDDEIDDKPPVKMKPNMGNGQGLPNMMMNGKVPQLMKGSGNNGGNVKKGGGGGGTFPIQVNIGGGNSDGKGSGKKGGNGNNQNQGGGSAQKGGKNGGGQPQGGKNGGGGGAGGGGQTQNGNLGSTWNGGRVAGNESLSVNGAKKGGGMNDGLHGMPNMMAINAGGNVGPRGNMPMGQMGNTTMGRMANVAAVPGLPAPTGMNGANMGAYLQGAAPEMMAGNPYYQQQMAAMMMNQQRANGNERSQPMMYAGPPPAVNYHPPYPYPYPYPYPSYPYPPPGEHYQHAFSDENTSSCSVM